MNLKFKSILQKNTEKVIPGTVFSKMIIEMDETTVMDHELNLSAMDILKDSAWIINFFLTFLSVGGIAILFLGLGYLTLGKENSPEQWKTFTNLLIMASTIIFIFTWVLLSVKGAIANKKRLTVISQRGNGNWRIVDEADWEKFQKLMDIAKKSREKEIEDFMKKKL